MRVARALLARDGLRAAFESGRVSYSAIRAISRLDDLDPDTEEALLRVGEVGSVEDVELAVKTYQAYVDQELPPEELWARRGIRVGGPVAGLSRVDGVLTETEADEFNVGLDAFADKLWREQHPAEESQPSPGGDNQDPGTGDPDDPVEESEESPGGDSQGAGTGDPDDPVEESEASPGGDIQGPGRGRVSRADALMDLVRTAMAHINDDHLPNSGDGVMVHYVHRGCQGVCVRGIHH